MLLTSDRYASRTKEAAILRRPDPVVYPSHGDPPLAALSPAAIKKYAKDGFVLLKGFFSERETEVIRRQVARLAADPKITAREEAIREPGGKAVRSVFMVHRLSPLLARLACDMRLANIARQILGSEVYIHQSRVNLKPGFVGKEFYWHSDFETWHVEDGMPAMRAVSCSILLTPNYEVNGPLLLIPGSHLCFVSCVGETPEDHYQESLSKQEYGVPDQDSLRVLVEMGGIRSMTGPAGSVVFFDCNTMHGSNSNISPYDRSNVFFVYNSIENVVARPKFGLRPRPEFVATRETVTPIKPVSPKYLRAV